MDTKTDSKTRLVNLSPAHSVSVSILVSTFRLYGSATLYHRAAPKSGHRDFDAALQEPEFWVLARPGIRRRPKAGNMRSFRSSKPVQTISGFVIRKHATNRPCSLPSGSIGAMLHTKSTVTFLDMESCFLRVLPVKPHPEERPTKLQRRKNGYSP